MVYAHVLTISCARGGSRRSIGAFRDGILRGRWGEVAELLPQLTLDDPAAERRVMYHVARQKFLETLEERGWFPAGVVRPGAC